MNFQLEYTDKNTCARSAKLHTAHGVIHTPIFMPVGTLGSVKGIHQRELKEEINAPIILGNAYHLYLRPQVQTLEQAGGLHKFIGWDRSILTDSGGYQVYSLSDKRKITEEGVHFKSHIDGSTHLFSPEKSMDIQRSIGGDIIMAFDECPPHPCDYEYARKSMEMTHRWLERCIRHHSKHKPIYGYPQYLFPIIQGSTYKDLRLESAEYVTSTDSPGYAIGGLSVGEPVEDLYAMTDLVCSILPKDKPRYLMGVGTPNNILECIALGVDMFDCVMPTRNGRNGMLFTSEGRINIRNKKWENDFSCIDKNGTTFVDLSYSKSYLRHLFVTNEFLGKQIASIHNLGFYIWLVKQARLHIQKGTFREWKEKMVQQMDVRL